MSNPLIVECDVDEWTKIATNVVTGTGFIFNGLVRGVIFNSLTIY